MNITFKFTTSEKSNNEIILGMHSVIQMHSILWGSRLPSQI